jgi:hypothetical protein
MHGHFGFCLEFAGMFDNRKTILYIALSMTLLAHIKKIWLIQTYCISWDTGRHMNQKHLQFVRKQVMGLCLFNCMCTHVYRHALQDKQHPPSGLDNKGKRSQIFLNTRKLQMLLQEHYYHYTNPHLSQRTA